MIPTRVPTLDRFFSDRLSFMADLPGDSETLSAHQQQLLDGFLAPADHWELPADVEVRNFTIAGPHGPVPLRLYTPEPRAGLRSAILWMHGGGFVSGTLDWGEAHAASAELALRSGSAVLSVDYRLAVEGTRYPVPLDDVLAAWDWLTENLAELTITGKLYVGGASAGANLAAAAAMKLRDENMPMPEGMLLAYGVFHFPIPTVPEEMEQPMTQLPRFLRARLPDHVAAFTNYLGNVNAVPRYAAPGNYDLRGMPRAAIVVCEFDDLRGSGELLARQLQDADVPASLYIAPGMIHGHLNWFPGQSIPEVDRTLEYFAQEIRQNNEKTYDHTEPRR